MRDRSAPAVLDAARDPRGRRSRLGVFGPGLLRTPGKRPPAFIRERFGAFGAFHLPAGGDSLFREPVTVVNVLGHVLRYYFNADLPESANDMYVSGQELFHFYPVEPGQYAVP